MSLLNYIKQIWDTTSYFNPTRMNHIEDGIYAVSDKVDNLSAEDIPFDSNNSVKDKIDTKAQIITAHFTDTTSSAGLVPYNDLDVDKLIKAYPQQGENYFVLCRQTSTGKCAFLVIDGAFNIVANTQVTIYLQYWQ